MLFIYSIIYVILLTKNIGKSQSISITWNQYLSQFRDINIGTMAYLNFKDNIDFIDNSNVNIGLSPLLHINRGNFNSHFQINGHKIPDSFKYDFEKVKGDFISLGTNRYFSWREKGILSDDILLFDQYPSWVSMVKLLIEAKYKFEYDINFNVDPKNILLCSYDDLSISDDSQDKSINTPYYFLRRSLKNQILLADYQRKSEDEEICIETEWDGVSNRREFRTIEENTLPVLYQLTGNINIYNGPIVAELDLDPSLLQFYDGSFIEYYSTSEFPNYTGLIIGYGNEDGIQYWIIQTNFGKSWGNEGSFKINAKSNAIKYVYQI